MGKEGHSVGSQPAVFRTAFGFPLYLLAPVLLVNVFLAFTTLQGSGWVSILFQVLVAAMVASTAYLMLSTKYRVLDGVLHLRMGPINRRIAIESISAISDYGTTRGRVYGLGTNIVGIVYEGGSVNVTPKDIDGFLAAIGFAGTQG